jgi:hypothetical protein
VSNELDAIEHLVRVERFPNQLERADDFANRPCLDVAINDAAMLVAPLLKSQEIYRW